LKVKQRQKKEAMDIEDAVTEIEIEMLMVVLYLAMGKR
jgi:hypothetical protein